MEQEQNADQADNDDLFNERMAEGGDGSLDEEGAVIGWLDEHAGREAVFQAGQLCLGILDHLIGVGPETGNDDAPHRFALAVQFTDTTAHFTADLQGGDIFQQNGCAACGGLSVGGHSGNGG